MRRISRVLGRPLIATTLIILLTFSLVVGLRAAGYLERLELLVYDQGIRWRLDHQARDPRIAIIGVTEQDLNEYGWPLSDGLLADVLERLLASDVRAVAIDFYRDQPIGPGVERLNSLLSSDRRILWVYHFGRTKLDNVLPPPVLQGTDQVGFADMIPDQDGIIRRAPLFFDDGKSFSAGLAFMMALRYLEPLNLQPETDPGQPEAMRLGATSYVPFEASDGGYRRAGASGYQILLDYQVVADQLDTYSLQQVLRGDVPPSAFTDRLVFVGAITQSVKDLFFTPFTAASDNLGTTHGVFLHAIVTSQLLRNALDHAPLTSFLDDSSETLWILIWCLLGGIWGLFASSLARFVTGTAIGIIILFGLWYSAFAHHFWIPLLPPALGCIGSAVLLLAYTSQREKAARQTIMRLFSSHVSDAVAQDIWRQRDLFMEHGHLRSQRLTATVLFSDIEDFTSISERLDAQEVMEWLSHYMAAMVVIITNHNGVVIRFFGDAVLALFGVPIPRNTEAEIDLARLRLRPTSHEVAPVGHQK